MSLQFQHFYKLIRHQKEITRVLLSKLKKKCCKLLKIWILSWQQVCVMHRIFQERCGCGLSLRQPDFYGAIFFRRQYVIWNEISPRHLWSLPCRKPWQMYWTESYLGKGDCWCFLWTSLSFPRTSPKNIAWKNKRPLPSPADSWTPLYLSVWMR